MLTEPRHAADLGESVRLFQELSAAFSVAGCHTRSRGVGPADPPLLLRAASVFGDLVRCAFDLHRRDLLARLGVEPPVTPDEESALWRALAQRLYRRGSDHPELIRYRAATADDRA